ncbi:hypothetical protein EC957_011407 [Mortierella hygrophila]|uniref:Uncharacterized protein n=1 Tax=Mortierella hygrophila TaxID=979708 RepID=A0A9P6FIB2_9FUNG|nr:hypothetical protein EC957_011407 [Mortierella hygrophila]
MAIAQAFTSSSSSTPPNTPSNTDINSIVPGTIFPDDSTPPSFFDSGEISYDSPTLSSSSSSSPHTANKSGGGDGNGSNEGGGGGEWGHIGQIEVNPTIETILVVLGFGVGALFVLGVVAMYYITHKNRRAEEKKKRREEESAGAKVGQSSTTLPLSSSSSSSSSSSLPLPSHPNISAGTGTAAAAAAAAAAVAVGRENAAHRIIITRSMTATTANTRVGAGGPNDEKDNGGGSGGLSPIGDGKSDMVSIYIDEMPDDDEIRARHHCDDDGCEEKQELDEKEDDEESLSQERNQTPLNAYSSPHNGL